MPGNTGGEVKLVPRWSLSHSPSLSLQRLDETGDWGWLLCCIPGGVYPRFPATALCVLSTSPFHCSRFSPPWYWHQIMRVRDGTGGGRGLWGWSGVGWVGGSGALFGQNGPREGPGDLFPRLMSFPLNTLTRFRLQAHDNLPLCDNMTSRALLKGQRKEAV